MYMKLDESKAENKMSWYFMAFMNTLPPLEYCAQFCQLNLKGVFEELGNVCTAPDKRTEDSPDYSLLNST